MKFLRNIHVWRVALGGLISTVLCFSLSAIAFASYNKFEPTRSYEYLEIEDWDVRVSDDYSEHPDKKKFILNELRRQLAAIDKTVPQSALSKIEKTVFWVEYQDQPKRVAVYHPSKNWLVKNDRNPDKADGITLQYDFYILSRKNWLWIALHELSHAYHHKYLGYDNIRVSHAFEKARRSKRYDQVKHADGRVKEAYAMKNKKEYFAELTETYFGRNDQEPFDRDALKTFDSAGFRMIQKVWDD